MNHNLKVAVELYSLGLLRLELPISDGKSFPLKSLIPQPKESLPYALRKGDINLLYKT